MSGLSTSITGAAKSANKRVQYATREAVAACVMSLRHTVRSLMFRQSLPKLPAVQCMLCVTQQLMQGLHSSACRKHRHTNGVQVTLTNHKLLCNTQNMIQLTAAEVPVRRETASQDAQGSR